MNKESRDVEKAIVEHYKELNTLGRHYDKQMWLVPALSYAIISAMYGAAYSASFESPIVKIGILTLALLIYLGLLLKAFNERAYQAKNSVYIKSCRQYLGIDEALKELNDKNELDRTDWSRKYEMWNAHRWVMGVMALTSFALFVNLTVEVRNAI